MAFFWKYMRRISMLTSLILCMACSATSVAEPSPIVSEAPAMTATVAPATATMPPSDTATPVATATPEPPKNLVWQDTFDNQDSGWEPKYVEDKIAKNMRNDRLIAANGYENGRYKFLLPVIPSANSLVSAFLWDFNTTHPLPAYPYQVDVDVQASPASNPIIILDFQGDVNKISAGSGLALTWGMRDPQVYKNVSDWAVNILEFNANRTWQLACTREQKNTLTTATTHVQVIVTATDIVVNLDATQFACQRRAPNENQATRIMGIGAALAQSMVPIITQNVAMYDNLLITVPTTVPSSSTVGRAKEIVDQDFFCHFGDGMTGEEGDVPAKPIGLADVFTEQVRCNDQYYTHSFDFPGYGPERLTTPNVSELSGNWSCGSTYEFAQFQLAPEKNYLVMNIAGQSIVVFYAKDVPKFEGAVDVQNAYVVTYKGPYGGNLTTFDSYDFAKVGDGVGSAIGYRYYFTYANNQITTNWTAQPCTKTP